MKPQENAFIYQTRVGYSDVDDKMTLRPSALVACMQNAAISHSNAVGYDLDWFMTRQRGWVLLLWHISITRLPREGQALTVYTWSMPYKRAQAHRDFLIEDDAGNEICYGASRWVLLDTASRRPLKYDKDFFHGYLFAAPRDFREETFSMPGPQTVEPFSLRRFTVTRRDTDFNGHTNNVTYIDWALDDIPDRIYHEYSLQDLRAEYKKECLSGAPVQSTCYVATPCEGEKEILSVFSDPENPSRVYCSISTIWRQ